MQRSVVLLRGLGEQLRFNRALDVSSDATAAEVIRGSYTGTWNSHNSIYKAIAPHLES
jgi:hypothetical protein